MAYRPVDGLVVTDVLVYADKEIRKQGNADNDKKAQPYHTSPHHLLQDSEKRVRISCPRPLQARERNAVQN